jgi:chromosome segregation ATPase
MLGRRDDKAATDGGFRGDIDALASRIDMLAAVVRETSGAVVAVRGEVASAERRLDGRLERDVAEVGRALTRVQDEIAALRARSGKAAPAASPDSGLAQEVAVLADRVRTLSGMVGESASRLAAKDGDVAALRDTISQEGARVDLALDEVRRELAALAARVTDAASRPQHAPAADSRLDGRVTALADRIDGLAGSVRETAGGLAAATAALAGADRRIEALATALETRSEETRSATEALEQELVALRERLPTDPASREHVARLESSVIALGEHVEAVSQMVHASAGTLASEDSGEELDRRLDALATHVDELAREMRERALVADGAPAAAPGLTEDELATRLAPLAEAIDRLADRVDETAVEAEQVGRDVHRTLAGRVDELERHQEALRSELASSVTALASEHRSLAAQIESVSAVAHEALDRPSVDPAPALRELAAKLEQIDEDRRVVAERLADAETAWADEREALRSRLEEITATAADPESPAGADAERLVSELTVRLDRLERERESVAELAALADGWTNSLATLTARVDYGLIKLQQAATAPAGGADARELVELAARVAAMESDRDSVLGELNRATESWAQERAALHERVAELAARIVTGPLDAPTAATAATVELGDASQELDRLRIGLEGIRMRLAYHEKTVAEIGSKSIVERLDELSARLDRLQYAVATGAAATGDVGGAGSLVGLDVGDLLRRLESAERAAQNQRKDMLGHLERVAARMDWRLHRLEQSDTARVV